LFCPQRGLLRLIVSITVCPEYWTRAGILEYWNNGMLGGREDLPNPLFQHSIIPVPKEVISDHAHRTWLLCAVHRLVKSSVI